jgi:eukaryotic-like serine/threonine-protein kinase
VDLRDQLQQTLGNTYTLERELGGAGMSRVFVAGDGRLGRKVVVKVLDPSLAGAVNMDRFTREIALAATLQHPCIVPVLSAGDMDGAPYYTMPLVDGPSLRQRLRDGRLSSAEAIKVLRDVASALDAAHRRGVVHRDVKPENVLLSGDYAMVTDFGIAKALVAAAVENRESGHGESITERGLSVGTPGYMAPEQVAGDETIDHRADIYAWGVLAYEVLTGAVPFAGRRGQALLAAHVLERPEPFTTRAPNIPVPLAGLVMRALEKNPAARPQSAGDLVAALDAIRIVSMTGDTSATNSIAVLPFVNMSKDPETDYFSDGVTDEIIGTLARLKGLRVTGRASSFALKGKELDLRTIGERLGVTRVVEGTVRRAGNRVRISAELVDVSDGFQRWSDRFDRDLTDVFAVQDEIARAIARALGVNSGVSTPLASLPDPHRVAHPEAYELYLKGMYEYRNRRLVHGALIKAVNYLEASVALDPTFAPVHSALASALFSLSSYGVKRPLDVVPKALEHARRAVAIDPGDGIAHAALAYVAFNYDWDWETALAHIDRALSLAPNDSFVLTRAAGVHLALGRFDLAFTLAERSLTVDPMGPDTHLGASFTLMMGGNAQRAIEVAEAGCRMYGEHRDLKRALGLAYSIGGRLDDAVRVLDEAVADSNRHALVVTSLAVARARRGDVDKAKALLDELLRRRTTEIVHSRSIADVLMALGRVDEAYGWYNQAVDDRDPALVMWGVDRRLLDPSLGDPRWEEIRQRIGIPS